jgi:demethylmenaquinone methyltransferase/2-methoxy-6-polyprenyl-1,4-benzoquinol methylase
VNPLYLKKASYFDDQIGSPWASEPYGPSEMGKLDRLFKHTGDLDGLWLLEPGCGTGRLTEILAQKVGESGRVVALDISARMVELARERVSGRKNVEVHQQTIEEIPIEERSFDLVLCHQVFPHLEDKVKALAKMERALKSGGQLIIFHFISFKEINDRHRKAGTAVENDLMPSAEEMEKLLSGAGLKIRLWEDDDRGYFLHASR